MPFRSFCGGKDGIAGECRRGRGQVSGHASKKRTSPTQKSRHITLSSLNQSDPDPSFAARFTERKNPFDSC